MSRVVGVSERPLLKIAVPNKGSLSEASTEMLREAGYRQRHDTKDLVLLDEANGVEFYYLRPRDIAVYVGEGTLDLGITGRDMLIDSAAQAVEVLPLAFGGTRFRFAAPGGGDWTVADLDGKRIATSYSGLVGDWLAKQGINARLIRLEGNPSTEGSNPPPLGKLAKSCCVKPKRVVMTMVGDNAAVTCALEP